MQTSIPIVLAVFTVILLALLVMAQAIANDFLRQIFNDAGRRSEGRRQRKAFEWCIRGVIGCGNYIVALHQLRDLPLRYAPEASTWLTLGQCLLGLTAVAFGFAAWFRLKLHLGY